MVGSKISKSTNIKSEDFRGEQRRNIEDIENTLKDTKVIKVPINTMNDPVKILTKLQEVSIKLIDTKQP